MQYNQKGRTGCLTCETHCKMKCWALFLKYTKNFKIAIAEHQTKHGDHLGMRPGILHRLHVHKASPEAREEICAVLYVPVRQNLYIIAPTVVLQCKV